MSTVLHDLRYALRMLRRSPGFAVAALVTLALGMGANTVMFSVLNTVLLRPLPFPQPGRLLQIWETDPRRGDIRDTVGPLNFVDWRRQSQTLESMATYGFNNTVLRGRPTPKRVLAVSVSAGFFGVFKIAPLKGRTFLADEDAPGKEPVTVLSYGAWQRHFAGDENILGKSIVLDNQTYSIIGVMPASFSFPHDGVEFWCVPGFDLKIVSRRSHFLFGVARMKAGISFDQAQVEMNTIAQNLDKQYGISSGVRLVPLEEEILGDSRRRLLVLWGAVMAVLLIACANVAGLLLARAVSRQKEVAIRTALGGTRSRLTRQFLTESVLLSLIGGGLGVLLAFWAGQFVVSSSHGAVPRLRNLQLDARVMAFTAVACIVTGLLFGLAPTFHALRVELNSSLKEGGTQSSQVSDRLRLRSVFVVIELAMALVLLVSAGLLTKTLWRVQQVDAGISAENVLSFRFTAPSAQYAKGDDRAALYQRIVERLAALPGVESVGATNDLPFSGSRSGSSFSIEGREPDPVMVLHADYRTVSPDYFQTLHIRLLAGRGFTVHDNRDAPFVAVLSQAFVKKFFPHEDPIGHRVKPHDAFFEIVGVVADVRHENLLAPGIPEMYLPYLQAGPPTHSFFVVRSSTDPVAMMRPVREAVKEVAPEDPIYDFRPMSNRVENAMGPQKFSSLLLAIFAGLALFLAVVGIYGVIAYTVAQRMHEIGIRIALGAGRADILKMVLWYGVRIAVLGLSLGTLAALAATRALSSMLFQVSANDPSVFLAVIGSLFAVVLLASYFPARKASAVDPMVALRAQ